MSLPMNSKNVTKALVQGTSGEKSNWRKGTKKKKIVIILNYERVVVEVAPKLLSFLRCYTLCLPNPILWIVSYILFEHDLIQQDDTFSVLLLCSERPYQGA